MEINKRLIKEKIEKWYKKKGKGRVENRKEDRIEMTIEKNQEV